MIQFRDEYAKKYGWNLIVESNMEAFKAGVGPFTHGSKVHTDLMKTQALLHALDKYKFDAAFGGARRDEEKSRAKERLGHLQCPHPQRRKHPCVPAEQLDRTGHLAVYPS